MNPAFIERLRADLAGLKEQGLYKSERVLAGPQGGRFIGAPPLREDADVLGGRNLGASEDPDPAGPPARGDDAGRARGPWALARPDTL